MLEVSDECSSSWWVETFSWSVCQVLPSVRRQDKRMGACLGEVVLIGTDLDMVKDETLLLLLIDGPHHESSFQV